jgi:hypothetical protein
MPRVGFKPTTPVFERAKTFHALDRADTVVGTVIHIRPFNEFCVAVNVFNASTYIANVTVFLLGDVGARNTESVLLFLRCCRYKSHA